MNNSKAAIETLKRALKINGFTYADVAHHLGMSEASIKKMFSTHHFTLKRIDRICEMIGMDFIDLIRLFDQERQRISTLSEAQEQELVGDSKLLLVAVCARNHLSFDEMLDHFDLTRAELRGYLARLETLKLLEIHPNDRIRLRVAEDFRWLPHGPIEQLFEKHLFAQFMNNSFDQPQAMRLYLHGPLTTGAQEQLNRRLNALAHEFSELLKESMARPFSEKQNVGLLLAMRDWEPAFVKKHRNTAHQQ